MDKINSDSPPKPCDYFDMIGGTGTGGLIAIMLGRLGMSVTECITAYTDLCDRAFVTSGRPINMDQNVQGRLSSEELEKAIKAIVTGCGLPENELLKDTKSACKVFVCAFSKETSQPVCFTSYKSPRHIGDLVDITTIWQACRATCASVPLFEPISIGPDNEQFIDCALGYNNPINIMWTEFQDAVERNNGGHRHPRLQCLVSIGSGSLGVEPVLDENSLLAMLRRISLQTDQTAETFQRNNATLRAEGRYYRFNVTHGLERIGVEESSRRREVAAAARNYISSDTVFEMITRCVQSLTSSFVEDRIDHVATIQYR
ncbi:hypothetical protein SEUCBS140593_000831 [Sporothrix eucalyptigena]|uniref:PNPLA domain-containing protein n=1 Tax=Sporothrix eucalyptigena TaxID=1812306 RepID=A0ABP0AT64_9PEZI